MKTRLSRRKMILGMPTLSLFVLLLAGGLLLGGSAAARIENNDAFCASCHTEPESTYYQRERTGAPVDLASAHAAKGVKCIDCHSGPGVQGRIEAMMLGARDALKYLSGHYPQPAHLTRPIPDTYCIKCHVDVLQDRTFQNHFHVLLPRWQLVDPQAATCVDCHQAHSTNVDPQLRFLNKATTIAVCRACHRAIGEGEEEEGE